MSSGDEALNQLGLETSGLKKMLEQWDKNVKKNKKRVQVHEERNETGGGRGGLRDRIFRTTMKDSKSHSEKWGNSTTGLCRGQSFTSSKISSRPQISNFKQSWKQHVYVLQPLVFSTQQQSTRSCWVWARQKKKTHTLKTALTTGSCISVVRTCFFFFCTLKLHFHQALASASLSVLTAGEAQSSDRTRQQRCLHDVTDAVGFLRLGNVECQSDLCFWALCVWHVWHVCHVW